MTNVRSPLPPRDLHNCFCKCVQTTSANSDERISVVQYFLVQSLERFLTVLEDDDYSYGDRNGKLLIIGLLTELQ